MRNKYSSIAIVASIIALAIISIEIFDSFVSRKRADMILDRSVFTGDPCSPPCWHGLILDVSTAQDVYQVLQELPFVDSGSIREWNAVWFDNEDAVEIHYKCKVVGSDSCGGVLLSNGTVKRIWFIVGSYATIENLIDRFGNPTYIDLGMWGAEIPGCTIDLVWADLGVIASYSSSKTKTCDLLRDGIGFNRTLAFNSIMYLQADSIPTEQCMSCDRINWPGFEEP
jgi:hypothetical protein